MNKKDLRVIKTQRSIKRVFSDLIQKKPLEKITVTEIASLAEINKGTFYLHYADIYALYDEYLSESIEQAADSIDFYADFFDAPEQFIQKFMVHLADTAPFEKVSDPDLSLKNRNVPQLISIAFKKRLYSLGRIEPGIENDIKLDFILFSLSILILKYGDGHAGEIVKILAQNIRDNFSPV